MNKFYFEFSHSKIQDYPSIGHINHVAKEKSVNIIWAVTEEKFGLYRTLSDHVSGSSAGILSADSSNIGPVHLIRPPSKTPLKTHFYDPL